MTIQKTNRKAIRTPILFSLGAIAILVLAACAPATQTTVTEHTPTLDQPDSTTAESSGAKLVYDFPITVYQGEAVLGGEEIQFSELFNQGKPVILNFWAGLCPPCRLEMPDFQEVYNEYDDQVLLVGVDIGTFTALGTPDDGRALLEELGVTYPTGTTDDATVVREYQVIGMPTTVFLKPNGEVAQKWTGLLTKDKLRELTDELLAASTN